MKKLAFVVGMSNYPNDSLLNPANDANSIDDAFKRLDIETIVKVDIGIADFRDGLDDYKKRLSDYEVALFFFAGHGMQMTLRWGQTCLLHNGLIIEIIK